MLQQGSELILLNRASGPEQAAEVRVGNFLSSPTQPLPGAQVPAHFRLLFAEQNSSKAAKLILEAAENTYEACQHVWGARLGPVSLVEVAVTATCQVNNPDGAAAYIRDKLTRVGEQAQNRLGRNYDQVHVRLVSGPPITFGPGNPETPLEGASIELTIDPVIPEQRLIVFTLLVRWPAMNLDVKQLQLPPQLKEVVGDQNTISLNRDAFPPTYYVEKVYNYLQSNVLSFVAALAR